MKEQEYIQIIQQLPPLLDNTEHNISILSNTSALLNLYISNINWVGFYLNINNSLHLGPFQGKPACVKIPFNKGVCGLCASTKNTVLVKNVHEFVGHIACDSQSNSEICIPIMVNKHFYGLLDIDSPAIERFDEMDKLYLEKIVQIIEKFIKI